MVWPCVDYWGEPDHFSPAFRWSAFFGPNALHIHHVILHLGRYSTEAHVLVQSGSLSRLHPTPLHQEDRQVSSRVLPLQDSRQTRRELQGIRLPVGPGEFQKFDLIFHTAGEPLDHRGQDLADVLLFVGWVFGSQGIRLYLPGTRGSGNRFPEMG